MSVQIEYEPNNICLLRISWHFEAVRFAVEQSAISQKIDAEATVPCFSRGEYC
jgi:hypothetical protein